MKIEFAALCAGMCIIASGAGVAAAQDMEGPPKVLVIQREWVKPGKSGSAHDKSESAFVNAFAAAKWPTHYFAAEAMSGKPRVLFFIGYPSFEAWEKDNKAMDANPALTAAIEHATAADAELLTDYDTGVFAFDSDMSLHTGDITHDRYFEVSQYHVKPGHREEWKELVKLYQEGFASNPRVNWACFESYYGPDNGGLYIAISKMASLKDDDAGMNDDKSFAETLGPAKMKRVEELTASSLDSSQTNLFSFNPKMSYPDPSWVAADPFWKPKSTPMAKKAAPATP
jgi:hypothetical protein